LEGFLNSWSHVQGHPRLLVMAASVVRDIEKSEG